MTSQRPPSPLRTRDFRLLWLGESISALGDQFALIALPWLALILTGSSLALGGVLAVMSIPRALLMVVGGVWTDRLSPRRVMLASNAVRLTAVGTLGLVVLSGQAQLWMLYGFALVFGVADAFFYPAQTSMVPELVEPSQIQSANGIVQGTAQLAVLVGPAVAGAIIATLGTTGGGGVGTAGIALALLLDAASFVASIVTLLLIVGRPRAANEVAPMAAAIREALGFVWHQQTLRLIVLISLAANLLIVGPIEVGLPVLAFTRLPEGAAAYGVIMSAFGAGSLVGYLAGAALPSPRPSRLGVVVLVTLGASGLAIAGLAIADSTAVAAGLSALGGLTLGYGNLLGMSWIQARVPRSIMGRVMSLLMFASTGLVPISELVAGALVQVSLAGVLAVAGLGMAAVSALALASKRLRDLGLEPPLPSTDAPETSSATSPDGATPGDVPQVAA
ncbi:MAG TPA: MFS transporter [Candidatus Limnocylindrales bacterium]|nr:MFS transporter [Candidatus Limnocylindrales bacterium]